MGFLKYSGDYLFTGHELLAGSNVLIMSSDSHVEAIVDRAAAGDDVVYRPGILSPGLVNAHCHLELSHLKGHVPAGTGMVDFLLAVIEKRYFAQDVVLQAIQDAEDEMLQDGIVAVGDICNTDHSFAQKTQQRLRYYNFIEATGFVPATAPQRYAAATALLQAAPTPASVVPHAPYSVSPDLFQLLFSHPQQVVSMHNQESSAENAFFETGTGDFLRLYEKLGIDISFFTPSGKSSLQTVLPYIHNTQSLLLVHDCWTNKEDITSLTNALANTSLTDLNRLTGLTGVSFCICPNANLYITGQLPDIALLHNSGLPICLGTDSLASNHQLSLQSELKVLRQRYPGLPVTDLLQWATLNGARALCMDAELGSFDKGKKPGIAWVKDLL